MRFSLAVVVVSVVGCGGASAPAANPFKPPPVRPGVPPPADEAGLRKLLIGAVTNGGVHFTDASCQAQFGHPGNVGPGSFDAFARCLGLLQLHPTGRPDAMDDVSVLADANGFELEAQVASGRLGFIGPSGRAPGMPDVPTITPQALEALRTAGDPNGTLSPFDGDRLVADIPDHRLVEYQRVCIGEQGEVTNILPARMTTADSQIAFARVTRTWKFRPFVVDGTPTAVCAIVRLQYPATPRDDDRDGLPKPPPVSKNGHIVYYVEPRSLDHLRLTGTKMVAPDDRDKMRIAYAGGERRHGVRLTGSFRLCLGEDGRYESGTLVSSTGVPGYDAKIARELMSWSFRPVEVDGTPIPVCANYTFIYTQR